MRICVFAGSRPGGNPGYRKAAEDLGRAIASRRCGLVYGGASIGLMGALADSALAAGGEVIGVIPKHLASVEVAHDDLSELKIVDSMHERKAQMAALSDAFIALPGGIGTLEETFEIWTWSQLGLHEKPIGLLNVEGFYDDLTRFIDGVVREGFLSVAHRGRVVTESGPSKLVDRMLDDAVQHGGPR